MELEPCALLILGLRDWVGLVSRYEFPEETGGDGYEEYGQVCGGC